MTKKELAEKTDSRITDTKTALQLLWDNINKGQRKQLIKIAGIKEAFGLYGVDYEE